MQDFKKLRVWNEAFQLVIQIYKITAPLQKIDRDLIRQTRRSASSISANLAEGSGRYTNADQAHFFQMAYGSVNELENHLCILRDLEYTEKTVVNDLLDQLITIRKMLNRLIRYKRK